MDGTTRRSRYGFTNLPRWAARVLYELTGDVFAAAPSDHAGASRTTAPANLCARRTARRNVTTAREPALYTIPHAIRSRPVV